MHNSAARFIFRYAAVSSGSAIYAAAVNLFFLPNKLMTGGLTGVGIIFNRFFGLPVGMVALALNIPLFILGFKFIGGRFFISTLYATVLSSVFIDLFAGLPAFTGDTLLAAIFGGVVAGAGLGIVFTQGATTGGTDIASRLLRLISPSMQMGRMMLFIDLAIIASGALVFGRIDGALYAVISLYIASTTIDAILNGLDNARSAYIITKKYEEVAAAIMTELGRGVTYLYGEGAFSGEKEKVILCAVKRQQAALLKNAVARADPSAFMIVTDAREVLGSGFKEYETKKAAGKPPKRSIRH